MDTSVNPCDDFYSYACAFICLGSDFDVFTLPNRIITGGGWMKTHDIPADRTRVDRSFSFIDDNNQQVLKQIVTNVNSGQLNQFYASCMNTAAIERNAVDPFAPFFKSIQASAGSGDATSLFRLVAVMHSFGAPAFFGFDVVIDSGNPKTNIVALGQGGLALPDSSYYLDADSAQLRADYVAHMTRMFQLIGYNSAQASQNAQAVLALETQIAEITTSPDELTDPFKTYNKYTFDQFASISQLPWGDYFDQNMPINIPAVVIDVPSFFSNLTGIVNANKDKWVPYLVWQFLHSVVSTMPKAFVDEDFSFFGKELQGQQQQSPRERTCTKAVDANLGEALGAAFARIAFPGASKDSAQSMIQTIEDAMHENLLALDWMDEQTRQQAVTKLSLVYNMIGLPSVPTNYTFKIAVDDYGSTVLYSNYDAFTRRVSKLQKPADRTEWEMTAATVNAYYDPTKNEMVFPAGILQTPFFNATGFPLPMNYGGIGMVMGHELSHGFDNQGRDYDGTGLLRDWWQPETSKRFNERVQCIIDQYSKFQPIPGVFVNGKLTQGENIADNGGIKLSYHAFLKAAGNTAPQPSIIPTLSNSQLFFVNFAQGWCAKWTDAMTRIRVKTDPHSPPRFRVLGPLMNFPEFSDAFTCPSGSNMNPTQRCAVW
jgi:putative endopeptidase